MKPRSLTPKRQARDPRWLIRMQQAVRLVATATQLDGVERHELLRKAARIVAALRAPRSDSPWFQHLTFRRSKRLVERAIRDLGKSARGFPDGALLARERLYLQVKRVVNKADPIGLLRHRASNSEYADEINAITHLLPKCRRPVQTLRMVHHVFRKWFGLRFAGPEDDYRKMAKSLHALRSRPAKTRRTATTG